MASSTNLFAEIFLIELLQESALMCHYNILTGEMTENKAIATLQGAETNLKTKRVIQIKCRVQKENRLEAN